MNILITGSAGFIDSNPVDVLIWQDHKVTLDSTLDWFSIGNCIRTRG